MHFFTHFSTLHECKRITNTEFLSVCCHKHNNIIYYRIVYMQIVSFLRKTCYQYDISTIFIQNTKCHNILIKAAFGSSFAWRLVCTKSSYKWAPYKDYGGRNKLSGRNKFM